MDSGVHIESRIYQISAKENMRAVVRALLRKTWFGLLFLSVCGIVTLALGYENAEPPYAILGLSCWALMSLPFLVVRRRLRASSESYDRLLKLTLSGSEVKLSDDVGNARVKPLCLLSKVQSEGNRLRFFFSDKRVFAVPLDAFTSAQVTEIQELLESLRAERQNGSPPSA